MKRYPRSFLQLITYGYILVAVPFLVATLYALLTLDSLSEQYESAINEVANSARLSYELAEDLIHMEKDLRRHEVLQDAETLKDYEVSRSEWQGNLLGFARIPLLPSHLQTEIHAQLALEKAAFERLKSDGAIEPLYETIEDLKSRSAKLREDAALVLNQQQRRFHEHLASLREKLLISLTAAILVAAVYIWLGRRLLSRLIGRFERALLDLGRGKLSSAISLDGPSDLRWLGRWLDWLRRRLLTLENDRVRLLRHVSHELKTPLAAINEGSSLLSEEIPGELSAAQRRIVNILHANSSRLQELIDGLLKLQIAENGGERINFESLAYDELVTQVIETHRLIAGERNIRINADLEEIQLTAGREALQTIVHNLLSNACKFSREGSSIAVRLASSGGNALLEVADSGPGIAPEDQEKVFEPFFRGTQARRVAGAGLGLAIAREFVLIHRGEIFFENLPAGGCCFKVLLPLDAPHLRKMQYG